MTSGRFQSVPISQIWVDRATRQRRELSQIPELADSISRLGLINPITVTRNFELKAGERRFEACKSLGWTAIPAQFIEDLDPLQLRLIELEENIKRVDISWMENCQAVYDYHQIQQKQDPEWSQTDTARAIGLEQQAVGRRIMVIEEMKRGNALITTAPKLSTAINIARRATERRAQSAIAAVAIEPAPEVPLVNQDFLTWETKTQFNFIHCDFPYGIDQQDHDKQASTPIHQYEDSFRVYEELLLRLESLATAPAAHLMFWFSMRHYSWTFEHLTAMGWRVDPFPLIWSRGSSGILPDPQRGPRRVYETAFMASKGDRKIVKSALNHVAYFEESRIHSSQKPDKVLEHFFQMFVDDSTIMLDPTCGSGRAVRVAEKMGARYVIGLEKQKEIYEEAKAAYYR